MRQAHKPKLTNTGEDLEKKCNHTSSTRMQHRNHRPRRSWKNHPSRSHNRRLGSQTQRGAEAGHNHQARLRRRSHIQMPKMRTTTILLHRTHLPPLRLPRRVHSSCQFCGRAWSRGPHGNHAFRSNNYGRSNSYDFS